MMPMALVPALFVWEWPARWLILIVPDLWLLSDISRWSCLLADASFVVGIDYARLPLRCYLAG